MNGIAKANSSMTRTDVISVSLVIQNLFVKQNLKRMSKTKKKRLRQVLGSFISIKPSSKAIAHRTWLV